MKALYHSRWSDFLLLLVWLAIGTGLRFTHLASKPPWNDEFATLVFSLGNSFLPVPLDRAIALDTLLMPLQPNPEADISSVIHHLMTESTHPPVYFVLTHLWMKLFPTEDGLVSVWGARSLSAIFGAASIPAVFGLGWLAFRSRLAGHMAAAAMATSPYGIYLAQEARHYTLAILLIIASLCCLVITTRAIYSSISLPVWVGIIWVGVNSLGIAVHYFFTLTLCAEALVLMMFCRHSYPYWWRIYTVAVGTVIGGLVWLTAWLSIPENQLTQWIYDGNPFANWLSTIARVLAWIITMLSLLPVEGTTLPIMVVCGSVLVIFVLWALPIFVYGLRVQIRQLSTRRETQALSGFVLATLALFFGITYGLGADLTIAARYQFVYFPAVIVLLGATLAICWDASTLMGKKLIRTKCQQSLLHFLKARGKKAVALILLMGLLGGVTVVCNFGYQKPDRPDVLVPIIRQASHVPVLVATAHRIHEQTREMMGLAFEFKRTYRSLESAATSSPLMFLLAHEKDALPRTLTQLPRPFDLWMVNFPTPGEPLIHNCSADTQPRPKVHGYKYQLYHCR